MEVMTMIKSMTGYGRGECSTERMSFIVEIKSVNHRYNEVMVRMPREWLFVEEQIKKAVVQHVKRGRVDVFLTVNRSEIPKKQLHIDWSLADAYTQAGNELQKRYHIEGELGLKELLSLPDLLQLNEEETDLSSQVPSLLQALGEAIQRLLAMRSEEGRNLHFDITQRLESLDKEVKLISLRAPKVSAEAKARLHQKVKDWLPEGIQPDEGRLLTEVALAAERSDISEEITRFKSHVQQFQHILHLEEPVGRQLDFLVQEMNREVNTIGSKANDLEIAQKVVLLKSELEKIREQVQNIE
jgi:uncharacterized protein (TIGR00255 family)